MDQQGRARQPPPNLAQWNANANYWDQTLGDGNNMFRELILPTIEEMAELKPGYRVLDLGTGNGIVARRLADSEKVYVLGTDYSPAQLKNAERRTVQWWLDKEVERRVGIHVPDFEQLDLLDGAALNAFAEKHLWEFDVVTASMLLKELSDLGPLAEFLPKVLKKGGKVIVANLHPCFHKPGAHRVVEVLENPQTGEQEVHHFIKVSRYLDIEPVKSQALRGQPQPLVWFHRPIQELLEPFFLNGMMMDKLREPAFSKPKSLPMSSNSSSPSTDVQQQIQSYEHFTQIPMQFIFRLVLSSPLTA
ncbi:S-adenosyl-L-methionine-dependent methyltransferase [Naviculisporaceae sp. PSN 640]